MNSKTLFLSLICLCLFSCKKPAGTGGNSSIKGTVLVKDYNKSFVLQHEYPGVDVEVYIIYGDDVTEGDKVNTNSNGEFEFKYLRKGNYKVYAIGDERIGTTSDVRDVAVSLDVTISKNKSTVDAGQITINK
jgi:hypothetical protein